ncbi:MAG: ABC-2 family transporter protein [Phycisphaerae bacterium]
MKHVLSAMPVMMRFSIQGMLQYRAEIALWALWSIVSPAVLMAVWHAAAASSITPGHVGRLSSGQMQAYFFMTMIVGHLVTAWDLYEMGWLVRSGRLSPLLLRPILPIWHAITDNVAYKVVTLAVVGPIWMIFAAVVRPQFDARWSDLLAGAAALFLAALLNFIWGYAFASLAFFVTKMDAISEFYFGASLFFGGRLAPIELLPAPLRVFAELLPFRFIFGFPSQVLAGQTPHGQIATGLAAQCVWLVVGIFAFRFAWRRGLRRYSAVGA